MALTKIDCGSPIAKQAYITDSKGVGFPFFVTGTDDDYGVIDMTAETLDYDPGGEFVINIETAGPIAVQLSGGADFIITQVQADAYLGQWYPAKIKKVYIDLNGVTTTGTFSVGV